ncbi:MAG: diacylglucosamine hydrolase like protein [Campylobacteraceae bacterium 4484_4]|nr:MAG: diacylglucosamine hydrolase like protein [Campylobacteraceae bacterium 4484_4]
MLVHICCSVDSHYFLRKLREIYPDEKLTGFFYDPNIHPYSEYRLRLLDVERSCRILGIDLIEGEYNVEGWLEAVRGYENEPEKGARCDICFDNRLEATAQKACELGEERITTTLLTSPKKSMEQLKAAGEEIRQKYGVAFVAPDFRKEGGTQEQFALAREDRLYHQDYCGCFYALRKQREQQRRVADELFVPLTGQIQPESIEDRIELYQKRMELEEEGKAYKIVREKFLNYRLLRAWIKQNGRIIPSYFLAYSTMKRKFTKAKISATIEDIYYLNREEIRIVSLTKFNQIINTSYTNIKDLLLNPPAFEKELAARNKIVNNFYSLSTIIVIEDIDQNAKFQVFCEAETYEDVREHLVILG